MDTRELLGKMSQKYYEMYLRMETLILILATSLRWTKTILSILRTELVTLSGEEYYIFYNFKCILLQLCKC